MTEILIAIMLFTNRAFIKPDEIEMPVIYAEKLK